MAREQGDAGFWLFEMFRSIWERFVRLFKRSQSPESLLESTRAKLARKQRGAYERGWKTLKGRKHLAQNVAHYEAMLDQFKVKRERAVRSGQLAAAQLFDAQIRLYEPMLTKARAQLDKLLTEEGIRLQVEANIARYRWKLAQDEGTVAELSRAELLKDQAEFQEELLGLSETTLDLWESEELKERARRAMSEVEARLELSGEMLRSGTLTEDGLALELGEPSDELRSLIAKYQTSALPQEEEEEAELDRSLLDLGPEV